MTALPTKQKSPPDPELFVAENLSEHIIIWPPDAKVAVIGDQWRRLPDGRIEAMYNDKSQLELCLTLGQWVKEWDSPVSDYQQASFFVAKKPAGK